MAKLNKEQYYRRAINAERRNAKNEEIAISNGMPEHWAELVTELCRVRHEMHCNIDHLVWGNECGVRDFGDFIVEINFKLMESGYRYIDSLPSGEEDYIEIETIDLIYETEDLPSDDDEREEYISAKYEELYDQWEDVNKQIEAYLLSIDKEYGTSWCPSGIQRML